MARFLDIMDNVFEKKSQNQEALRNDSGPYLDLRKDPDVSSLEEMANDIEEVLDRISSFLKHPPDGKAKFLLEEIRYKLANWTDPVCCICAGKPAEWSKNGDGWYCEKCGGAK
jgi:hypothetical protein